MAEYRIETIEDILKIPQHQIVEFLVDLHKWYEQRSLLDDIMEDTAKLMIEAGANPDEVYVDGKNTLIKAGPLIWKDDGISNSKIVIKTEPEPDEAVPIIREPNNHEDATS